MKTLTLLSALTLVSAWNSACSRAEDESSSDAASGSTASGSFGLESSAFEHQGQLPDALRCQRDGGSGKSPPLAWSGNPDKAQDYALVMYHYPNGSIPGQDDPNHYWLLWNLGSEARSLAEGNGESLGTEGSDKDGAHTGYTPPCSPAGSGTHSYTIRLHALSAPAASLGSVDSTAVDYAAFMDAIEPLSLDFAELTFSVTN